VLELLIFLRGAHYWLSRLGLGAAILMFLAAFIIGVIRKGDVTPRYRKLTYAVAGLMVVQTIIGGMMYLFLSSRPFEEVHLIYGLGMVLALPFFIFVEKTAEKRPAMGSYIWGFAVLTGIIVRGMMTGAVG
jgi:heme A synthase